MIDSVWWFGFGGGRLAGVVLFKFLSPTAIILIDFLGVVSSMTILCLWGEQNATIAWVMTITYSFFQGTLFPAGVSWIARYLNMSGKYISIFFFGSALGPMSLIPAAGWAFDRNPFNVMYMILGETVANALVFGLLMLEGRRVEEKVGEVSHGRKVGRYDNL